MEFIGVLKGHVATREGDTQNGHWERRQYLVEEVNSFPRKMVFEITDGEIGRYKIWDALVGQNVVVTFIIDASQYNGRWFNNVSALRIETVEERQKKNNASRATEKPLLEASGTNAGTSENGEPEGNASCTTAPTSTEAKGEVPTGTEPELNSFKELDANSDDLPF